MQVIPKDLGEADRRTVRKWRLISAGFYGSILAALILYMAFNGNHDVDYASLKAAASADRMMAPAR